MTFGMRGNAIRKFADHCRARVHSRSKTQSAGRKNGPAAACRPLARGPNSAMRSHRFVTPCGFRRLRDVFPSVARTACSRVFFANGPEPFLWRCANFDMAAGPRGTEPCCDRRTIATLRLALRVAVSEVESASGRSRASVGKRQRERQKSRQVTDLPCDRQVATATVSPAVSLFAAQHGSVPLLGRPSIPKDIGVRGQRL